MSFYSIAAPLISRFSVIPIEPNGKRPPKGIGAKSASRDGSQITAWSEQFPDANVAIVADSEIAILETDDLAGFRTAVLAGTGHDLPVTLAACGSSENRPHFFFKHTERSRNVGNLVVPGIFECRFSNQYVVAAGSVHPNGSVYRWLNDAPISEIPDWLVSELARLALAQKQDSGPRKIEFVGDRVPEGSRHYFLMSELGRAWNGKRDENEMIELALQLNERCEPPKDIAHVISCVRDVMRREPFDPGPKVTIGTKTAVTLQGAPAKTSKAYVYGVYRRGVINICHGPSGVGKTSFHLEMEDAARSGREFLGYRGVAPASILYILRDRPLQDHFDTLDRMGLPRDFVPVVELDDEIFDSAAAQQIADLIEANRRPELVVIEGMDVPVSSTVRANILTPYLKKLQRVAEHTGCALVGTWGAPKRQSNPRERYLNPRDAAAGSGVLARLSNTMVGLSFEYDRKQRRQTGRIVASFDTRQAASRSYTLKFQDGRLIEHKGIVVEIDEEPEPLSYDRIQELAGLSKAGYYKRRKAGRLT